mmetsp:Transcript_17220/g.21745  ORF Transcript_17220/g.21745 Transcript_17220/m.21745 type:complete len:101 (-) Transcript_17220:11-313(-)
MGGFYASEQMDIIEPYFDKFFDILPFMHEKSTHKTFESFFFNMLPRMAVKDAHIVRLVNLLQEVPDTDTMFAETLKDGLDVLIRIQQIRTLANRELQARL